MAAFSITYLLDFEMASENFTMSFQSEMIPWIVAASLAYGMIVTFILIFGGFTLFGLLKRVDGNHPWFNSSKRDAATLRNSRRNHANSPCQINCHVSDRIRNDIRCYQRTAAWYYYDSIPTYAGHNLLKFIIFIPDEWIRPNRRLEVALACYLVVLIMVMRVFLKFARKHITIAAFTRRWLISMTKLSWLAPF